MDLTNGPRNFELKSHRSIANGSHLQENVSMNLKMNMDKQKMNYLNVIDSNLEVYSQKDKDQKSREYRKVERDCEFEKKEKSCDACELP